jgi:hypothetical protein
MFKRQSVASVGEYMRRGLEPIAQSLGVDYDESFRSPPQTPETRVFDAYRVGQSLLMFLSYPEGWTFGPKASKKLAKRAARTVHDSLLTESGRSAVSHMTQGYAREMAALWRRAADDREPDVIPEQLRESARRSDELGDLAARFWPAEDPHGALDYIAHYERQRVADPDNPHAMIHMHGYYGRASVAFGAALIAMGPAVEELGHLAYLPVAYLDLQVASGLQHDWAFNAEIWQNLISEDPLPYLAFVQSSYVDSA